MVKKTISPIPTKISRCFIAGLLLLILSACSSNKTYDEYREIPDEGWSKSVVANFQVDIKETTKPQNILINIRHTNQYAYQNFWMFITTTTPGGITTKDTVECYLADNRGKWLGNGISSVYNMPVLFKANNLFSKKGLYRFSIYHGMRDDLLKGISDIGIEIEKAEK